MSTILILSQAIDLLCDTNIARRVIHFNRFECKKWLIFIHWRYWTDKYCFGLSIDTNNQTITIIAYKIILCSFWRAHALEILLLFICHIVIYIYSIYEHKLYIYTIYSIHIYCNRNDELFMNWFLIQFTMWACNFNSSYWNYVFNYLKWMVLTFQHSEQTDERKKTIIQLINWLR